jgi:hypothetical protein
MAWSRLIPHCFFFSGFWDGFLHFVGCQAQRKICLRTGLGKTSSFDEERRKKKCGEQSGDALCVV